MGSVSTACWKLHCFHVSFANRRNSERAFHFEGGMAPVSPTRPPRASSEGSCEGSATPTPFRTSKRCGVKRQLAPCEARMLTISTYGGALTTVFHPAAMGDSTLDR
jgi:hypothetical protein